MSTFDFRRLISPCVPATFIAEYWDRQPLLVSRDDPDFYRDLFSPAEMEAVISFSRPAPPDMRIVLEQAELPAAKYVGADDRINMNQVYKAYGEGHTIVINQIQRFVPKLARLARQLQELMNFSVEFNAYLTPANSRGLHAHFDTHDVFALQIHGAKTWRLYGASQESPLVHSFQPVIPDSGLPAAERAVELKAGDLLYLPRGHVHDADTGSQSSLHLTIGVYPVQWKDLIATALNQLAARDVRFRKAVPIGFLDNQSRRSETDARFRELLQSFAAQASSEIVFEAMADQLIRESKPVADGQLDSIAGTMHFDSATMLVKREHMRCRVTEAADSVSISFPGNTIKGTLEYKAAMVFVTNTDEAFAIGSFPGDLDAARKVLFAQRLVRGGLLRIAAAGG